MIEEITLYVEENRFNIVRTCHYDKSKTPKEMIKTHFQCNQKETYTSASTSKSKRGSTCCFSVAFKLDQSYGFYVVNEKWKYVLSHNHKIHKRVHTVS